MILAYGLLWILIVFLMIRSILKLNQKKVMLIIRLISLILLSYKTIEYLSHWIALDFTKMPVEYSAVTYILFSMTFLFNIKLLKPFVSFAAFLSGAGYLVTFPFLGSAFIDGNGLTTTLLALFNHSLLFIGSILVMRYIIFDSKTKKSILILTLMVVTYSISMQYIFNFEGKYLFIYMVIDGRILYSLFDQIDVNGFVFLPYNIMIISIYLGMISIFYKVNHKVYHLQSAVETVRIRKEVIKHEHTV